MSYPKGDRIRATALALALCVALLMFSSGANAWSIGGNTYTFRWPIISNSTTANLLMNINDTYAPNFWANNQSGLYLFCQNAGCSSNVVIGYSNLSLSNYENGGEAGTGNNPTSIYEINLLKYFHMENNNSVIQDSTINSVNCSRNGAVASVSGKFGKGIEVGTNNNLTCGLTPTITDDITVEVWIYPKVWTEYATIVVRSQDNPPTVGWGKGFGLISGAGAAGSGIRFFINSWNTNFAYNSSYIPLNAWYHVVGTYDKDLGSNQIRLYINGQLQNNDTLTAAIDVDTLSPYEIGGGIKSVGGTSFNGIIDEVRIYNRTLTQTEITEHYRNGINNLTALGAVETDSGNYPPVITINKPANATQYGGLESDFSFLATDDRNTTFSLKGYLNGDLIYDNDSYLNGTGVNFTYEIIAGQYNFTVVALDPEGLESSLERQFYNFYGLNISVFKANGSAISGWNMEIFGGEDPIYNMSLNNPTLINYEDLGSGTLTFIFNYTDAYDFVSNEYDFNSEMGLIPVNVYLYQYEYFTGQDYDTSANITTNITLYNSTFNISDGGTDRHKISLRYLPLGSDVSAVFTSVGYNNSATSYNINLSSYIDSIVKLIPAGVLIKAYNEENVSEQLYFNYLISNGTSEISGTAVNEIALSYTAMPQGDVRLNIWNASYVVGSTEYSFPTRAYFFSVNQFTANRFNAYLLRSDAGFYQTFYVIDQNNQPIEAALITISKVISSVSTTVAQEKTNPAGAASIFIKPYVYYALRLQKDGYLPIYEPSITFTPAVNPQYVYLTAGLATLPAFYNVFYGVQMNIEPADYYIRNITSPLPTNCSVFAEDGNIILSSYSVYRVWNNGTDSQLYSVNSTDPSGNTFIYNGITASGKYKLRCYVEISYDNNVSVMSLETYKEREIFFYEPRGAGGLSSTGFAPFTLELIAVIVIAFVIVFFTQFAGIWAGAVGLVVGGFFVAISWLPFFDFVLTCLVFAAAIVIRYVMI